MNQTCFALILWLISHQPAVLSFQNKPATSTFLSEQISNSHQPSAKRTGSLSLLATSQNSRSQQLEYIINKIDIFGDVFKENLLPRIQASSNYSVLINFHFYDWANMQIGRAR
jgi:hypothetical protein